MCENRYPAIKLPKLDIVGVGQFPGSFFCCLFVGTIKIGRGYNVAVFIHKVNPVVRHPHAPPASETVSLKRKQDHGNLVGTSDFLIVGRPLMRV